MNMNIKFYIISSSFTLRINMEFGQDSENLTDQQIKTLLTGIQNVTVQMSNTFEQAIIKHEEQFIRTYRIKIAELTKLFEELTKVLEDKFINNALTNRLNIVMKERDYFKYQCLKLNVQYQTVLNDHNNLSGHVSNVTDQMKIYKHLLEDEKIKNKQLQKNAQKFKTNFSEMAYKTLSQTVQNINPKFLIEQKTLDKKNKKIQMIMNEMQQKNEIIRNLKIKISQLQLVISDRQVKYIERNQLYETFKACTNSWKRDILTKQRKKIDTLMFQRKIVWNTQKLSVVTKKELLRYFFTSDQFLKFIQKLLFTPNFKIQFIEVSPEDQKYMIENRVKLFDYMRKKKIIGVSSFVQR